MVVQSWRDLAACKGSDRSVFFLKVGRTAKEAKDICDSCLVQSECLEFALTMPISIVHGIWAGKSPRELNRCRMERRTAVHLAETKGA